VRRAVPGGARARPRRARATGFAGHAAVAIGVVLVVSWLAPVSSVAERGEAMLGRAASAGAAIATLSNLRTLSRWAYPETAAPVHERPSASSPVVDHLRFLTGDGQAQVYLALRSYTVGSLTWVLLPMPGRPNGIEGWVPASALGELHVRHEYLRVNRETLHATLFRDGHAIWRAPVGVGRPSLPTPAGHFYVTEKLTALGGPFYGPYAIGTSAYAPTLSEWPGGGVVGIHGTDEPQLVPGHPSHGCVRLRNADIARLWALIGVGTPIEIV
jgi:L,D-transpeptidase catalytic domain